ncbi:helix-turn-helix domain-containing protein [Klebsiella pneumoniae]
MKVELTPADIAALEAKHRQNRDRRVCDRIRCVLLSAQGWPTAMIAQSQLIHETTVLRHLTDYLSTGKMSSDNGGSLEYLNAGQSAELRHLLTDTLHITTASITSLVRDRFGVRYSIPGMNKWLHRNGFTWKKPSGIHHKFCPEKQQQFVKHYETLKQAAGDSEPILFMDAVCAGRPVEIKG